MGRPFAAGGLHDGNGRGHGRELILHGSHGSAEGAKLEPEKPHDLNGKDENPLGSP